jgi:hypothetical protein
MTAGTSPLTTGNGSSSGFELCACAPARSPTHLPGDALVELVLRRRLSLRLVLAHVGALHLPERGRTGLHQTWRRGRFAQMGQDLAEGTGVGDEGDDSHPAAAAWTDERKDLMDPHEQQRPGVTGGATEDRFRFPRCFLCPLRRPAWRGAWRSGHGCRRRTVWHAGERSDLPPQRRVRCQHPVVTMPMSAWRRNQRRQTLDQFEGREHEADAAAGTRLDALVDQVFGVDFTPALQREGRASAIPQQTFQTRAVGALDAQAGVEREAATMRPVRHRLGVFRLEHTAADQRAQQTAADLRVDFVEPLLVGGTAFVKRRPS